MKHVNKVVKAVEDKAKGALPTDLLALLLPIILQALTGVLDGCLNKTNGPDAVKQALTSDSTVAGMYRYRAIQQAAEQTGKKLTFAQYRALSDALVDVGKTSPDDVIAATKEFTRLDFSAFE